MEGEEYGDISQHLVNPSAENQQIVADTLTMLESHQISAEQAVERLKPQFTNQEVLQRLLSKYIHTVPHYIENLAFATDPKPLNSRAKSIRWTQEEDNLLLAAVQEYGNTNWGAVASKVGNNRTKAQCSQRFNRVLNPKNSKANWSPEEEERLLQIVAQVGNKAWTRVATQLGNRSDVQCRFKYNYIMKKLGKHNPEDNLQFTGQSPN